MTVNLLFVSAVLCFIGNVSCFGITSSSSLSYPVLAKPSTNGRCNLNMRWGLKGKGSANQPMGDAADGKALRDTVPFELRGFSLPLVVFSVGTILTFGSFIGYFLNQDGGGDAALSSLGFVYGIPVFLIGLSLWYAEIPPVRVIADEKGLQIYELLKTDTMDKIKRDVTRHRYGDDAHLDSTLESLGLKLPQKKFPKMQEIILEETPEGELSYTMTFQSAETPYKVWSEPDRVKRYTTFFGPGVVADVVKVDADKRLVGIKLVTTSKGLPVESVSASSDITATDGATFQ